MFGRRMDARKTALVMVGLPARGKSYTARKLARYLTWLGHPTRVFNVGQYRRNALGSQKRADFFDPENRDAVFAREELAQAALDDLFHWLFEGGEVGIYDATNTTVARRRMLRERCEREGVAVIFIESICDDPALVAANVRETKLHSPDYAGVDPEEAVRDFRQRIAHYERSYEPLVDDDKSYVKLINAGQQVVINRIEGYLPARVVYFLMNLRLTRRPIWLTRHGESLFNIEERIGGDSDLTVRGELYARSLARFMEGRGAQARPLTVWTSTMKRTMQTVEHLPIASTQWRILDEIDAGVCDGMTYAQIRESMPTEWIARGSDKFRYRYPRGESYEDVIQRVDPLIVEIERHTRPLLIVAHQAVIRALYAYLMDRPPRECPHLPIPLHTVIELSPNAYGCDEHRFPLDPGPPPQASASVPPPTTF